MAGHAPLRKAGDNYAFAWHTGRNTRIGAKFHTPRRVSIGRLGTSGASWHSLLGNPTE